MHNTSPTPALLEPITSSQASVIQLICFSHAGGSAAVYRPWVKLLDPRIQLVVCQLPGRANRLLEAPYDAMAPLLADLVQAMQPFVSKPFALFGHSMGTKVAYELALALQQHHNAKPLHFFAAASSAPFHVRRRPNIHALDNASFIAALKKLGGTPSAALDNAELMELCLPALRADFKLVETYINSSRTRVDCELSLLGGVMDHTVTPSELADWSKVFSRSEKPQWFPGDHFFINQQASAIIKTIHHKLLPPGQSLNVPEPLSEYVHSA